MKVIEHVKYLLRQGRAPTELVELGFPKSIVTRVRRQLRDEKTGQKVTVTRNTTKRKNHSQSSAPLPLEKPLVEEKLLSLESKLHKLEAQVELLKTMKSSVQAMKARLEDTPALGLKQRFQCACGAAGFVALRIQCTKCGRETYWGWWPKE